MIVLACKIQRKESILREHGDVYVCVVVVCECTCLCIAWVCVNNIFVCALVYQFIQNGYTNLQVYIHASVITQVQYNMFMDDCNCMR